MNAFEEPMVAITFIHRSKSVVPVKEIYGLVQTLNLSSVEKFRATPICFTVISLVTGPSHVVWSPRAGSSSWTTIFPWLRWWVNNFMINYLPYMKCLISLVVWSLTAKLDIQVLYGKYYLCNKSWHNAAENSTESSGWVLQFFITFHSHSLRATSSTLAVKKVQQSLECQS